MQDATFKFLDATASLELGYESQLISMIETLFCLLLMLDAIISTVSFLQDVHLNYEYTNSLSLSLILAFAKKRICIWNLESLLHLQSFKK